VTVSCWPDLARRPGSNPERRSGAAGCSYRPWPLGSEQEGVNCATTVLTLFNYPSSRNGWKVRLLLQHLGRTYRTVTVNILDNGEERAEYRHINPTGKVPAIQLDDGRTLAESNAILVYLAEGSAYLPNDPFNRAKVLQWMSFEQEQVESTIGTLRYWMHIGEPSQRSPELIEAKRKAAKNALGILDHEFAKHEFITGDRYTIADIAVFAYATCAEDVGVQVDPFPHLHSWSARVGAQPGFLAPPR
jgi:glutathione S-transferase